MEKIVAGIARDGQLGKNEELYALLSRLLHEMQDALDVVAAIRDAQPRTGRRHANETVLKHTRLPMKNTNHETTTVRNHERGERNISRFMSFSCFLAFVFS